MFSMPWREQNSDDRSAEWQSGKMRGSGEMDGTKDDYLLKQIDEFREKAKQLQDLLDQQEGKSRDYRQPSYERDTRAEERKAYAPRRPRQEDDYSAGAAKNMGYLMDQMEERIDHRFDQMNRDMDDLHHSINGLGRAMDEKLGEQVNFAVLASEIRKILESYQMPEMDTEKLSAKISESVSGELSAKLSETLTEELKKPAEEIKAAAAELKDPAAELKRTAESLGAPITEMKETVESLKAPMAEMKDTVESLKAPMEELKETVQSIQESAAELKETAAGLKEPMDELKGEVKGIRSEILEKIHTEGVQVFRNTRDLIDEQAQHTEHFDEIKTEVRGLKTNLKIAVWFGVVNLVVLIVYVLYALGVFRFS